MVRISWPCSNARPFSCLSFQPHHTASKEMSLKKAMDSLYNESTVQKSYMVLSQKFYEAMNCCGHLQSIVDARKIHAQVITIGLKSSIFLQNHLINMYSNCNSINDARQVFSGIAQRNVFSWNTMITCLSNSGHLTEAGQLFDEMPERNSSSWNIMMIANSRHGEYGKVVRLFISMTQDSSCKPDPFTLAGAMNACGSLQFLELGQQLHCFSMKLDFGKDPYIRTSILGMYVKCDAIDLASQEFEQIDEPSLFCWNSMIMGYSKSSGVDSALELFHQMPERDLVSWNTVISILSQHGHGNETLSTYIDMQSQGFDPNSMTYASVLSACASVHDLGWGKHLHARIVRKESSIDVFVGGALVDMYAKCGCLEAAKSIFDSLPDRNTVSWTCIIGGFAQFGLEEEALALFNQMREACVTSDQYTLATVLGACSSVRNLNLGIQLHVYTIKMGYESTVPVANALLTMYAKCESVQIADLIFQSMPIRDIISWTTMITAYSQVGDIKHACELFKKMTEKNVVTWNSMLAAYIQNDHWEGGLKLYSRMLREGIKPDWITFTTLLGASADLAALRLGNQIIGQTIKFGTNTNISIANGMVTMYSKCGRIGEAQKIFDSLVGKDLVSWNAMITGYSQNGQGRKAIQVFEDLLKTGTKPDYVTYIALLSGCSHSGLVSEGQSYFKSMTKDHSISPRSEHFVCMVDLLGRAGLLEQAKRMIDEMPIQPTSAIWGALLSACRIHGNTELAEYAVKHLSELDLKDSGSYVLLANTYADAGKLDDFAEVRKLMREKRIQKNPGCSWIEADNRVHVFTVDDTSHPQINDVYRMLDVVLKKIGDMGYVNDSSSYRSQGHHSERLAVAFGLVKLPVWMPIHVMKNLRICCDCHTVIKLISLVTSRELIVRDANRFHHFRDGSCSCGDYW